MTIREIAQRCGVSRGTVDRVINGRGKVSPDTEALILHMLTQVGYTKNTAGRALNIRKTAPVIGVVLSSDGNPFFDPVIDGIWRAASELTDYRVTVRLRTMRGYRTEDQLACIGALEEEISALVLQPINDPAIVDKIRSLAGQGIPTVTVNSDLEGSPRQCYVGSDYLKGGETAAGLMRLVTGGRGRLGIIAGAEIILGHAQRRQAFEEHLARTCPGIRVAWRESAYDDIGRAYQVTAQKLSEDPAVDTLMIITAGLEGVYRAVFEAGRGSTMRLFAFDNIPKTEEIMRAGLLCAVVCQQPFQQGYQAVRAAFDIILHGRPSVEKFIMENQIKILENLSD